MGVLIDGDIKKEDLAPHCSLLHQAVVDATKIPQPQR